jgi:hypothetical protein
MGMDTSQEFIKMLREAYEVQQAWDPNEGDWMATKQEFMPNIYVISGKHELTEELGGTMWFFDGHLCNRDGGCLANQTATNCMNRKGIKFYGLNTFTVASINEFVFIPRQDQLQKMIFSMNNGKQLGVIFMDMVIELGFENDLESCALVYNQGMTFRFKSIEMCLLAVLMHLLGKQWNGETWTKCEGGSNPTF